MTSRYHIASRSGNGERSTILCTCDSIREVRRNPGNEKGEEKEAGRWEEGGGGGGGGVGCLP